MLNSQLNNLEQIILGGLISLACVYATIYFNKAIQLAQAKAKLIKDDGARTLVTNIKDGKVDKTELNNISTVVKENVLKQLGTQATDVFNKNLGDINSYVANRIENNLADLKLQEGNSVSKTVIPTPADTNVVVPQ